MTTLSTTLPATLSETHTDTPGVELSESLRTSARRPSGSRARFSGPTFSAYEALPDGRERCLVAGLRYTAMLAWRCDDVTWAVAWRVDPR